jgi:hypothetical protein
VGWNMKNKKNTNKKWIERYVHLYFNRFKVEWGAMHTLLQESNKNECPKIDGGGKSFQSNNGSWC